MISFRNILNFPSFYRDRQDSWRKINPSIIDVKKTESDITIVSMTGKYEQNIVIHDTKLAPNTRVTISCTCPSFNFEFANTLFKNQGLNRPEEFMKAIQKVAKEKNPYNIPSGCKHIIALANLVMKKQHKLIGGE